MTTFSLARTAIGDPDLPLPPARKSPNEHFDIFDVNLPLPKFIGIPQSWTFAVLNSEHVRASHATSEDILADAWNIVRNLTRKTKSLMLLSDDPTVHLVAEFLNSERDVFCLDATELRSKDITPRLVPFILALRRRLNINPLLAKAFSPYLRNTPVSGWRFFGRDKQLDEIITGQENLVVVGARRVGKTSLLREAERRLKEEGRPVHYVDVQNCRTANEVVTEILRVISPRDAARAMKHHEVFHDTVFSNLLKQMAAENSILLLDELGNVLSSLPSSDWKFMGTLRKYGSRGGLKYVISCFQELYFKQQKEFEGPLINFAHTLRLNIFTRKEVEDFVIAPLDFWQPMGAAKQDLLNLVISTVGSHPYFLQYFCHALFERIAESRNFDPLRQAQALVAKDLQDWFATAVDEIFIRIPSSAVKYLFLHRCEEAYKQKQHLNTSEFTDEWIENALSDLGFKSSTLGRRNLLDSLEMHGLCAAVGHERSKRFVAAPLVYQYMKHNTSNFEKWLFSLGKEVERERVVWDLT